MVFHLSSAWLFQCRADARWSVQFCLLEQYLPAGAEHPFAHRMIQHFNNLQTPLRSIHKYPKMADQQQRFQQAGWSSATVRSLWDLWTDISIVSAQQKIELDAVEPFDEWEEFVLFASHYFILLAARSSCESSALADLPQGLQGERSLKIANHTTSTPLFLHSNPIPNGNLRRFGASLPVSDNVFGHHGGIGSQTRLGTVDFYGPAGCQSPTGFDVAKIEPRMCHSISAAGSKRSLLVGGRTSPANVLKDCWLLGERSYRVDDLPISLYRHSSTQVNFQRAGEECLGVLVYGGKTGEGQISHRWLLWRDTAGWTQLGSIDNNLSPRFGAAMASTGFGKGLLIGGMNSQGTILSEIWEWSIMDDQGDLSIAIKCVSIMPGVPELGESEESAKDGNSLQHLKQCVTGRMGACLVDSPFGLLLIGGVSEKALIQDLDITRLTKASSNKGGNDTWHFSPISIQTDGRRPLLVSHTTHLFHDSIIILGGGAVCFSFGAYWNQTISCLTTHVAKRIQLEPLVAHRPVIPSQAEKEKKTQAKPRILANTSSKVGSVKIDSAQHFERVVDRGHPCIIRGPPLGSCTTNWTLDVLKAKVGIHRSVSFDRMIAVP